MAISKLVGRYSQPCGARRSPGSPSPAPARARKDAAADGSKLASRSGCSRPCSGRRGAESPSPAPARAAKKDAAAEEGVSTDEGDSPGSSSSAGSGASTMSSNLAVAAAGRPRGSGAALASWRLAFNALSGVRRLGRGNARAQASSSCLTVTPARSRTSTDFSTGPRVQKWPSAVTPARSRTSRTSSAFSAFSARSRQLRKSSSPSRPRSKSGRSQSRGRARRMTRRASEAEVAEGVRQLRLLLEPGEPLGGLSDFAKAYGDDVFCKRLLRKYNGNVEKSADKLKQALVWREKHRYLIETGKCGIGSDERVIGADKEQRPVVYLCMKNQFLPGSKCMDQKAVCMLQAIESMPPGVEKTVHIWDLHGQKFRMSDLNPTPLIDMMKSQEGYFADRLQELVIIGMPRMAALLKDAVWPVVPESTRSKIKFMSLEESQQHLRQTCDAEVFGRVAAAMEQNRDDRISLEDRKKSWMRIDRHGALVPLIDHA